MNIRPKMVWVGVVGVVCFILLVLPAPAIAATANDYDGDGKTDVAVFRPSLGTWFIIPSSNPSAPMIRQWGAVGDIPVPGDYDGDGKTDLAVWRPSTGTWFIIPSSNPSAPIIRQWGTLGDIPVPGDYDGDGKTDMAVWRPSTGTWFIIPSSNPSSPIIRQWGTAGDIPVPGDYDGDGKTDTAVWRPSSGTWFIIQSSNPGTFTIRPWGTAGDIPVPGDYDGDGKTDTAVWRPSSGTWFIIQSSNPGTFTIRQWGMLGDVPVPGDYDGDGKTDTAVWRPSNGTWFIIHSSIPSVFSVTQWGTFGDLATEKPLGKTPPNEWTWVGGSNLAGQRGVYGTLGIPAPSNVPGAREDAVTWTDTIGNLWLFGGLGLNSVTQGDLNDLWMYSAGQWTWMGGSNMLNQSGTYGTQGTPAQANTPGARVDSNTWTDASGNFFLFGGDGRDSAGNFSELNDLWEYSAGEWTWMSGSNTSGQKGIYGTLRTAAADNVPGGREGSATWIDASGNLWLFGGFGYDSTGTANYLNDLWMYSAGQWTWMGGSNMASQSGTYGTQGTPAPNNTPGARAGCATWIDTSGNFWLFGGRGFDSVQNINYLNDLWMYSAGQWTWVSGSNMATQSGTYGALGTPAPANVPGARYGSHGWTDVSGNFWLFGGSGTNDQAPSQLNDLWKYSGGQWTWMSGSNFAGQGGTYGTLGVPDAGNIPGARAIFAGWTDPSGNFWLFGGGLNTSISNDLWKFGPY